MPCKPQLPPPESQAIAALARAVQAAGGRALLAGGCVRDALMGRPPQDADVEVYGLEAEALDALLRTHHEVITVGRAFGVWKLKGLAIDVALPRTESQTGPGHRDFAIQGDPHLDFATACARRDFTINSILADPLDGSLIDPHHGAADIAARRLRHTSPAFAEDPLRVLRGMQFVARFELAAHPETLALCRQLNPAHLPRERLFEEWRKLIVGGVRPRLGLEFLRAVEWLRHYPELQALIDCPQDPHWHPEGDVWTHTGHTLDAFAAERLHDPWEDLIVGLAALCHDLGKPACTRWEDGRWRSPGHEVAGEKPARAFLARITEHTALIEAIIPLVKAHMRPTQLHQAQSGPSAIRRLARDVERIDRLVRVARADARGRPPLEVPHYEAGAWLLHQAAQLSLQDQAPRPIIQGRHLVALGQKPGPQFKALLQQLFEHQLEGTFTDESGGIEAARTLLQEQG